MFEQKSNTNLGETMNIRLALLLTRDPNTENVVTDALKGIGAKILVRHDIDHALEIGCSRASQFDVVIIDRADCHAMTLLSALHTCRHDLPVIVIASSEACHCAALAYANGAAACLAKPVSAADLKVVLRQLCEPKLELAAT
jgi:DNA-binding NtrC family response regulator